MGISVRTLDKANRLLAEKQELLGYMQRVQTRYEVLTDQYMNGDILWDIGKDQARLMREHNKYKRRVEAIDKYLYKVRTKYGLPM